MPPHSRSLLKSLLIDLVFVWGLIRILLILAALPSECIYSNDCHLWIWFESSAIVCAQRIKSIRIIKLVWFRILIPINIGMPLAAGYMN